jgi:hypothetical protein
MPHHSIDSFGWIPFLRFHWVKRLRSRRPTFCASTYLLDDAGERQICFCSDDFPEHGAPRSQRVKQGNPICWRWSPKRRLQSGAASANEAIYDLAQATQGGNYEDDSGVFYWSNRTARNCIRHCLTNYEVLWGLINRGDTGRLPYQALREPATASIDSESW